VTDEDFAARVAGIALLHDPIRRALYDAVRAAPDGLGREQAAERAGVARNLAAFHLDKLVDAGLLDVEQRRLNGRTGPGAGRPAKVYRRSATEVEVSLPPREYDLAASLLAAAIEATSPGGGKGGAEDVRASLATVARAYGADFGVEAERRSGPRPSAARRRAALLAVLAERGFEPVVEGDEIVLGNCPFHALARQFTDLVCGMNLDLMEGVRSGLGLPAGTLQPILQPEPGRCCVRFGTEATPEG
jgi:predicted ArsR family transcriptional regulator